MRKPALGKGFPHLKNAGFVLPAGVRMSADTGSSYEGARMGRRLGSWGTSQAGPNQAVQTSVSNLRSRSHEVIRNNPYARSAIEAYVTNIVGSGIRPRWNVASGSLKEELQLLWNDWVDEADAYGQTSLYGLQELAARTEFESGEAIIRFRTRRMEDGLSVPLQLQVFEPDHLDFTFSQPLNNGNYILHGIEMNAFGQRVAYHLFSQHPGDGTMLSNANSAQRVRVPASEIMHIYRMLRPGQVRGICALSSVMVMLKEIDETRDSELVRRKISTLLAGFIRRSTEGTGNVPMLGFDEGDDDNGNEIRGLEPATMQYLEDDEDITWSNPPDIGAAVQDFLDHSLQGVAAGAGMTFEQITGNLSKVNFSSIRAGLIEFRRKITMLQKNMLIFQLCRPIANRFIEIAVASGAVSIPDFVTNRRAYKRISWRPDAFEYVKPLEDTMTDIAEVRAGFKSREDAVSERGRDIEDVDRSNKASHIRADADGLVYDSDPRQTAKSGTAQKIEDASAVNSVTNV